MRVRAALTPGAESEYSPAGPRERQAGGWVSGAVMPYCKSRDLLMDARKNGYSVGGFDVFNLELLEGVVLACEESESPAMVQISFTNFDFLRARDLFSACDSILQSCPFPVALHLDHGSRAMPFSMIGEALAMGFRSIMVDGSHLPLSENIRLAKDAVTLARRFGACVEGELGQVSRDPGASREAIVSLMTDPDEAERFVGESGIDFLAVSVGSISSCFDPGKIDLDLPRLEKISRKVAVPLVFHGGTGIPDESMRKAIQLGVAKVNVAHGLRKAYISAIRKLIPASLDYVDPRPATRESIAMVRDYVKQKLQTFGSVGRARGFQTTK